MALKVLFLYNHSWAKEIADFHLGIVPAHRLFGLAHMEALGHHPLICPKPKLFPGFCSKPAVWRCLQAIFAARHQATTDCIVATAEASALPVLLLKRLRLLKTPLVMINIALLHPKQGSGLRKWLWKMCLPAAEAIISYTSAQSDWLAAEFGLQRSRLFFVPFGVDTTFFEAEEHEAAAENSFCASVGTNDGKDFVTLLKAFPDEHRLVIVTDDYNIKIIQEHLNSHSQVEIRHDVPIHELRTLYRQSSVQIIPLLDTKFSSGQTVMLENMALGRAVIVTKTASTCDYIEDGITAIMVAPGDPDALRRVLVEILEDPPRRQQIGAKAAEKVRASFSSEVFSRNLMALVQQAIRRDTILAEGGEGTASGLREERQA